MNRKNFMNQAMEGITYYFLLVFLILSFPIWIIPYLIFRKSNLFGEQEK